MFGLHDWGVGLAFGLSLLVTALCVVYGLLNWKGAGDDAEAKEIAEEAAWEKKDDGINDGAEEGAK